MSSIAGCGIGRSLSTSDCISWPRLLALVLSGAALSILDPASGAIPAIGAIYRVTGTAGLALGFAGASALLVRRITDPSLRIYTTPGDLFNLVFFIVTLGMLSAASVVMPPSAPDLLAVFRGMLTLDTSLEIPGFLGAGLVLAGLLVAYIPLTHMSHFIAKYFTYHAVRWDDRPNPQGGKIEARVAEYLAYKPTWSAAHVGADGKKSWLQIAAASPPVETKK